jgi:hypothetical protein
MPVWSVKYGYSSLCNEPKLLPACSRTICHLVCPLSPMSGFEFDVVPWVAAQVHIAKIEWEAQLLGERRDLYGYPVAAGGAWVLTLKPMVTGPLDQSAMRSGVITTSP